MSIAYYGTTPKPGLSLNKASSEKAVADAFAALGNPDCTFIMLRDETLKNTYMEATLSLGGINVDLRDGETGRYCRTEKVLSKTEAAALFLAYHRGDEGCLAAYAWRNITDEINEHPSWIAWTVMVIVASLAATVLAFCLAWIMDKFHINSYYLSHW